MTPAKETYLRATDSANQRTLAAAGELKKKY
jgi:hypothetical protein